MHLFTEEEHRDALIRRRIRFVVYYPRWCASSALTRMVGLKSSYSNGFIRGRNWLERTAEDPCWAACTREAMGQVRWGLFAKVIYIVIYGIIANRELFAEPNWHRLRPFLHVPIDSNVIDYLQLRRTLRLEIPTRA